MDITEREGTEGPLPNLKGGHSVRADFKQTDVVVKPLVRDREGLIREDLLRLKGMSDLYNSLPQYPWTAHSEGAVCLGGSGGESCITSSAKVDVTSSSGVVIGVGSTRVVTTKGALWGSGDISIESLIGPGEEEGSGGVLARSVVC